LSLHALQLGSIVFAFLISLIAQGLECKVELFVFAGEVAAKAFFFVLQFGMDRVKLVLVVLLRDC
jgi:hypothetical protein